VTVYESECLSSMTFRSGLLMFSALVVLLAAPGVAHAACAPVALTDQIASAPVVVTAMALPGATARGGVGLVSPAEFRVVRYEKGSGPGTIEVATALSTLPDGTVSLGAERINPLPGQRWLLWGSFDRSGQFATTTCLGSRRASASVVAPQLRDNSDEMLAPLRRSAYDPAAISGASVTVRPGRPLTLITGVAAPVDHRQDTLRLSAGLRAKVAGTWRALDVQWQSGPAGQIAARLKSVPAHTTALQLLTPSGFFAVKLRLR